MNVLEKEKKYAIGLMSGTSLDGIDAALVEIKGSGIQTKVTLLAFETIAFSNREIESVLKICNPASSSVDEICRINVYLGEKFASAALAVMKKANVKPDEIDFISSHGQTIYHMPAEQATMQIGELAVIAEKTGILTVGDFRPSDMAAGGQGAPLVPFVDYLLFRNQSKGRILLNIGGMSNLTVIPANANSDEIVAFDTGPGNVLIDAIVQLGSEGKVRYDHGGSIAKKGTVDCDWLQQLLNQDSFIKELPPKSTGREHYTIKLAESMWNEGVMRGLSFEDIVATITCFTAESIAYNIHSFIDSKVKTDEVFVGGGGVHNTFLMDCLRQKVNQRVAAMEEVDVSSDAKEAIAFAILGNEFLHGNTNNLPSATGASRNVIMGKLVLP